MTFAIFMKQWGFEKDLLQHLQQGKMPQETFERDKYLRKNSWYGRIRSIQITE